MSVGDIIERMNTSKWEKWIDLFQTVALVIILPWSTWVTVSVFRHNTDIQIIHQWQDARPKFVTTTESDLAITRSQDVLRRERDILFKEIQGDLKELLKHQQEIRLELMKHTASTSNGNGKNGNNQP